MARSGISAISLTRIFRHNSREMVGVPRVKLPRNVGRSEARMGHRAAALLIAMVASIGLGSVVAGLPLRDLVLPVAAIGSLAVAAATGQRRLLLAVSAGL